MNDHIFGMLDMGLVGVAVLGLAIWQLVSIHRESARDKKAAPPPEAPEDS
ncbi:hypothetical protein SPAN111604_00710 [Sphingomonas antarctica]